jgi:hypothetical protein
MLSAFGIGQDGLRSDRCDVAVATRLLSIAA